MPRPSGSRHRRDTAPANNEQSTTPLSHLKKLAQDDSLQSLENDPFGFNAVLNTRATTVRNETANYSAYVYPPVFKIYSKPDDTDENAEPLDAAAGPSSSATLSMATEEKLSSSSSSKQIRQPLRPLNLSEVRARLPKRGTKRVAGKSRNETDENVVIRDDNFNDNDNVVQKKIDTSRRKKNSQTLEPKIVTVTGTDSAIASRLRTRQR